MVAAVLVPSSSGVGSVLAIQKYKTGDENQQTTHTHREQNGDELSICDLDKLKQVFETLEAVWFDAPL